MTTALMPPGRGGEVIAELGARALVRDLNQLYRSEPALHRHDCQADGFEWIEATDVDNSVFAFLRRGAEGETALVICNFTPIVRRGYRVGAPAAGQWTERLNTDAALYGGSGVGNGGAAEARPSPWHGRPFSLELTLPPLATLVFTHKG